MASVSGVLMYGGQRSGSAFRIGLFPVGGNAPAAQISMARPGAYSIEGVRAGRYEARAALLAHQTASTHGADEILAYAIYQPSPLVIDAGDNLMGINFSLGDS